MRALSCSMHETLGRTKIFVHFSDKDLCPFFGQGTVAETTPSRALFLLAPITRQTTPVVSLPADYDDAKV